MGPYGYGVQDVTTLGRIVLSMIGCVRVTYRMKTPDMT
jgi:hypothetical protein